MYIYYLLLDILHKVGTISKNKHLPKWAQKPVLWPDYCLIKNTDSTRKAESISTRKKSDEQAGS